jgi:IS605 OrfB family transposase
MVARGILASQKVLLPDICDGVAKRIQKTERKLERETGKLKPDPIRVRAMARRLKRLTGRQADLQQHLNNGTVPAVLFGGKRRWVRVLRSAPGARTEWQAQRSNQYLSRGAKNYQGNPHCRLKVTDEQRLKLLVRLPDYSGKEQAHWLPFEVSYSRQYKALLMKAAHGGAAGEEQYTVRLIRLTPGHYRAFITVEEPVPQKEYTGSVALPPWCSNVAGIDLNLDHLAVVAIDAQGQFRARKTFDFPNLGELPRTRSRARIGSIAREVVEWALAHGVQALVLEDLSIQHEGGGSAKYNRRTIPFTYRQMSEMIARRGLRKGLIIKRVNPAYTSVIGNLKYAKMYGISGHIAAAYVIARRGLGLQERLPKALIQQFGALIKLIEQDVASEHYTPKQLRQRREWIRRLSHWRQFTPEAGRPWLMWATLHGINNTISGARSVLERGTTNGRNDTLCRPRSADNIRPV